MAPKTTSKAEKAREEELEKGRIAAMKASNAEDPLWKVQRKEQALASDLGIDPDLKAKEFLAALMTKGTEATGLSELKKDAGISDPKAVLAASNLNQAYKVLKGLWRFGMTRDLLRIAAEMGLIKLLKTLKKRHPDGKIKGSAGQIIEKWMAMEQAGSATDSVSKDVSSFTTSSSSAPSSASESASVKASESASVATLEVQRDKKDVSETPAIPVEETPKVTGADMTNPSSSPLALAAAPDSSSTASSTASVAMEVSKEPKAVDEKLRNKVKAALSREDAASGLKPVCESAAVVAHVEEQLYATYKTDKDAFKTATRKLVEIIRGNDEKKAKLNAGDITVTEVLA